MASSPTRTTLTRRELYDLVWSRPTTAVARELGISDRGLGKICKGHQIPKPPRGYWAKVKRGIRTKRQPLPKISVKQDGPIEIRPRASRPRPEIETAAPPEDRWERLIWNEQQPEFRVVVPEYLAREQEHELVRDTRQYLEERFSDQPRYRDGYRHGTRHLHAEPGPRTSIDRCCRLWQAIIDACESRGWSVRADYCRIAGWSTKVEVAGYDQFIWINSVATPKDGKGYPNPRLSFFIGFSDIQRSWTDGRQQRLENVINEVFVALLHKSREDDCEAKIEERKQRVVDKIRSERKAVVDRYDTEKLKAKRLHQMADEWQSAERLRAFVAHVRSMSPEDAQDVTGTNYRDWFIWADHQIARIDPTMPSPRSILDDRPRETWFRPDRGVTTHDIKLPPDEESKT